MLLQHPRPPHRPPPHQPLVDLRELVKSPCISPFLEDPLLPPIIIGIAILRVSATTRADAFPSARNETLFFVSSKQSTKTLCCLVWVKFRHATSGLETVT